MATIVHAKMDHVNQTMPLLWIMYHPFGKTGYSFPV